MGASEEDTFSTSMNYTEMLDLYGDRVSSVIKRNFYDILYHMNVNDKRLNIRETLADPRHHDEVSTFIKDIITDIYYGDYEVAGVDMVFMNAAKQADVDGLAKSFRELYKDYEVIVISSSNGHTNRAAEKGVKKIIEKSRAAGKKVLIMSRQMADRSFSVPDIGKVIVMSDGAVSSADYQKLCRALTWKQNKNVASLIRISFTELSLKEDILLNEHRDVESITKDDVKILFKGSNFFESEIDSDGDAVSRKINVIPAEILDVIRKRMDSVAHISIELLETDGLLIDRLNSNGSPSATKSKVWDAKRKALTEEKLKKDSDPKIKEYTITEAQAREYAKVIRILPAVCDLVGEEQDWVLSASDTEWVDAGLFIDRELFIHNYANHEQFTAVVDRAFRNYDPKDESRFQELTDCLFSI